VDRTITYGDEHKPSQEEARDKDAQAVRTHRCAGVFCRAGGCGMG